MTQHLCSPPEPPSIGRSLRRSSVNVDFLSSASSFLMCMWPLHAHVAAWLRGCVEPTWWFSVTPGSESREPWDAAAVPKVDTLRLSSFLRAACQVGAWDVACHAGHHQLTNNDWKTQMKLARQTHLSSVKRGNFRWHADREHVGSSGASALAGRGHGLL